VVYVLQNPFLLNLYIIYIDREGPGGADVYILCPEEFTSVGMLSGGSSLSGIIPPEIFPPTASEVDSKRLAKDYITN
jgi:hypothetical protein